MSANTTPDGITYPVGTDAIAPLHTIFATMASTIQTAFNNRTWLRSVADLNALAALTGMPTGGQAVILDNSGVYQYSGSKWFQIDPGTFSTAALRDAAFAKASGAYLAIGATVYRSDKQRTETYFTTATGGKTVAGWYQTSGNPEIGLITAVKTLVNLVSVTKQGGVVTLDLSTNFAVATNGTQVASIPAPYWPPLQVLVPVGAYASGAITGFGQVLPDGTIYMAAASAPSLIGMSVSYRAVDTPVAD
jgi:hypothetical protein